MTWDGKESMQVWRQEGCGPSAVVGTGDGKFLVTCYDANALVRITSKGETLETLTEDQAGQPLVGPNDAVVDAKGGVYFSVSGVWDIAAPIDGKIFYISPGGTITEVADDIHYSNGLALSPDGGTLYASEMAAKRVLKFEVDEDGTLGKRYLFVRLRDLAADPQGVDIYMGPDGLKTDRAGNLYIAAAGRQPRRRAGPNPCRTSALRHQPDLRRERGRGLRHRGERCQERALSLPGL
jgi:gluconolactonase